MWIFGVIAVEAVAAGLVIYAWLHWDAQLKAWEDRQLVRIRNWWSRRKRNRSKVYCTYAKCFDEYSRGLADGINASALMAEDEMFADLMRLLGE
jgi:hypothetical protein